MWNASIVALGLLACEAASARATPADSLWSLPPASQRRWQTGAMREDRLQHAALAAVIGLGVGIATRDPWAAAAVPATLGLGKEIADRSRTGFDRGDLAADLVGAGAAAWIISRTY